MTAWSGRVPTLASMLRANDEAVSADWAWLVHNMPGSSYGGQPLDDLRASTSRGLRAIIEALHTGFDRALDSYLKEISLMHLNMGFEIAEVIEALLLFEVAALPVVWRSCTADSPKGREMADCIMRCSHWMAGHFGAFMRARAASA